MQSKQAWKKPFFTIVAGQTVSLIGSSAVQFVLIWWLASETNSPIMLALSGLAAFLPQMLLGPFAGVWIDRLKRKTVVIAADLFQGVVALLFAAFFLTGAPPYWSACLVLGARAVGGVFHTPAIQAVVPLLVPPEQLVKANGWSQFLQSGAFMLGPVLGAVMYSALPMPVILLTDFLGALAASGTMLIVRVPEVKQPGAQAPHFLREMKEGLAVFRHDRRLLTTLVAATVCMIFYMPLSTLYPLMTSSYFKASALHGSLVEFLYAAGMMGSALVLSRFDKVRDKLLLAHGGLFFIGVTSLLCGLLPARMWAFWIFALLCMLMGAGGNVYNIPCVAYMQETVAPEALGRAFSLMGSLMSVTMPIGLLISGPVAERFGVPVWFFITGAASLIIGVVSVARLRQNHGEAAI